MEREVAGRAGEDGARVSAEAGGRMPETGAGTYVHEQGAAIGRSPSPFTPRPPPPPPAVTHVSDLRTL